MSRRLGTVTAQQALVAALRDRILSGDFQPGTTLSDEELARDYGVARPTVRGAVQQMVYEGLLRREPRRRAFVPRLSLDHIRDLYFARTPIELAAVELLVGAQPDALRGLLGVADRFDQLTSDASWRVVVDTDIAFHSELIRAAGNGYLVRAYGVLQAEMQLALVQLRPAFGSVPELAAQHRALVDVIARGRRRDARRLMREHLDQSAELLMVES